MEPYVAPPARRHGEQGERAPVGDEPSSGRTATASQRASDDQVMAVT